MNWGTLCQEVLADAGRPASELDRVKLKLIDAMARHRAEHYWFNEIPFNFTLTAGTDSYDETTVGFPAGLVGVLGDSVFVDLAGSASSRYAVTRSTIDYLERCRASGPFSGQPEVWALSSRKLELYPSPADSTDVLRGRAFVDQWVPIKRYSAGWKFYLPGTTVFNVGNELTDAYPASPATNPWITEAHEMIRLYATYLLWSQVWQATDGQDQKALQAYVEARSVHDDRTRSYLGVLQIEPYPMGGGE
jgi:hypothetical protein